MKPRGARTPRGKNRYLGVSDIPNQPENSSEVLKLDFLQISTYYQGLAEFVSKCVTPMTIAVQGEWGTGKTSALYSVKTLLEKSALSRVKVIYINTWQYALFGSSDLLVFSVIRKILSTFKADDDLKQHFENASQSDSYREKLSNINDNVSRLALAATQAVAMGRDIDFIAGLHSYRESGTRQDILPPDSYEELYALKDEFAELVAIYCALKQIDRVVFLVDDMDRLEPKKAVELLEVFKVLLDVKKTTFVLALDFEVVKLGLRERFRGSNDSAFDQVKARSFFDKIVQVPFNMPVSAYDPSQLINQQLESMSITIHDDSIKQRYAGAVRFSVGNNPRSIKRLFNAFSLTRTIMGQDPNVRESAGNSALDDEQLTLAIFLLMCLEVAYPKVSEAVDSFVQKLESDSDEDVANEPIGRLFTGEGLDQLTEAELEEWDVDSRRMRIFTDFAFQLQNEFESAEDSEMNVHGFNADLLVRAQRLSSVTSVSKDGSKNDEDESDFSTFDEKLRARGFDMNMPADQQPMIIMLRDRMEQMVESDPETFSSGITIAPLNPIQSPNYTAYLAHNLSELSDKYARSRPKFLDLRQNKRSLQIGFGVRTHVPEFVSSKGLTSLDPDTLAKMHDPAWEEVITTVFRSFEPVADASSKSVNFGFTFDASFAPIVIKGITNEQQLEQFLRILPLVHEAAINSDERSFLNLK